MRIQIPDYFKTPSKILGFTYRQLATLIVFGLVCTIIAVLPTGTATYIAMSFFAFSLPIATLYLLFERFDIRPTLAKLILPIVFGTTLVFALTFLVPIAATAGGFYMVISNDLRIKVWAVVFTGLSGIVFAFTDVMDFINDFKVFRAAPRDAGWIDPSVRRLVPVEMVENNLVYLKDGSIRTIHMVTPLSADTLKEEQYKGIYRRYKEFLNSINGEEKQTGVQVVMRMMDMTSRLEDYFDRGRKRVSILAEKEDNKRLLQHFLALEGMLMKMAMENTPMVPRFYLVINHDPLSSASKIGAVISKMGDGFERWAQELQDINITSRIVSEKLQEAGIRDTKRINTNELATLYRGFLAGLEVVDVNYLDVITRASICSYCQTGRIACRQCVEHGGSENRFILEDS